MIHTFRRIGCIPRIRRFLQIEFVLQLTELLFRLVYGRRDSNLAHNAKAMDRFKQCSRKKPKSQIEKEILLCKKYWRCYPFHYFRYELYKADRQLSEDELIDYIPEFFFYYLFITYYNSNKFEYFTTDKGNTEKLFTQRSISQGKTICKLENNHLYTSNLEELLFKDVWHILSEKKYKKLFVKPLKGKGGHGIYIFNRNASGQYVTKDDDLFNEDFLQIIGTKNDYLIQMGIEQDIEMEKIYSHSVNTFRFLTENKNGVVRILSPVFFRVGRGKNQVDNYDQGGLLTTVDVKTGALGEHASSARGELFKKHPDTNFIFNGYTIPQWNKIKDFVIECVKKIPELTFLSWDVALTLDGPLVVEINFDTGLDGLQIHSGGLREMFGIDDPRFYWKNKGRRI